MHFRMSDSEFLFSHPFALTVVFEVHKRFV